VVSVFIVAAVKSAASCSKRQHTLSTRSAMRSVYVSIRSIRNHMSARCARRLLRIKDEILMCVCVCVRARACVCLCACVSLCQCLCLYLVSMLIVDSSASFALYPFSLFSIPESRSHTISLSLTHTHICALQPVSLLRLSNSSRIVSKLRVFPSRFSNAFFFLNYMHFFS
jgi:hypothetical protein